MPGFTTHFLFGQNIKDEIDDKSVLRIISKYDKCFNLGLQGPDIFFYYLPSYLSRRRNIGNVMHDTDTMKYFHNLFAARDEIINPDSREIADAYIYGFLGHYSIDCACHPYIYYRSHYIKHKDRSLVDFGNHTALETDIDKTVLRASTGKSPSDFHPGETIHVRNRELITLSHLICKAIRRTYPGRLITPSHVRNAIRFMRYENNLMSDRSGLKKMALRGLEQILFGHSFLSSMIPSDRITRYTDCCNERHHRWVNPWDSRSTRRDSIFELMVIASGDYLRRIELYSNMIHSKSSSGLKDRYRAANELLADLGDCSYLSGLPLS